MAPTLEATPPATPQETTTANLTATAVKETLAQTSAALAPAAQNGSSLASLDASILQSTLTTSPRTPPAPGSAEEAAQRTCTDHMITASWTHTQGWAAPELKPYGPLSLMPTASCLHYATECFEGMKLYRGFDGKLRLFRPNLNVARMKMSASRIALPAFDEQELLKLVVKLCATDGAKWLPKSRPGGFLYIRPTMIASDPALGVQKPKEALLYIILCCFPPMDTNTRGMRLLASWDNMVRAWPGGFGFAKVGANYGPTLLCQGEARARGFDQILWLFGKDPSSPLVTEAGASNFFVVWKTAEGKRQMVTAPLGDKIILDGVTRRSVLELARTRLGAEMEVVERELGMKEVWQAWSEGRLEEAFVCGTAFFVSSVSCISWREEEMGIKVDGEGMGNYAGMIKNWLKGIMYGKERNEWGYVIEES